MATSYYESDRAMAEYLLFHYCLDEAMLPRGLALSGALNFPARCVSECVDGSRLPAQPRALDLGCAVGRASFELARRCAEVIGIDYSERFVTVAGHLKKNGSFLFGCIEEGDLTQSCQAVVAPEIDRSRVSFERGDAMALRRDIGNFDVVLMANLIDRLKNPRQCLTQTSGLVKSGGQLIIISPCTWLAEFTPRDNWLGGFERDGHGVKTLETLQQMLSPAFVMAFRQDMPFLIREHARKFQLGVAEASIWLRK